MAGHFSGALCQMSQNPGHFRGTSLATGNRAANAAGHLKCPGNCEVPRQVPRHQVFDDAGLSPALGRFGALLFQLGTKHQKQEERGEKGPC